MERKPDVNRSDGSPRNGLYQITDYGVDFIHGKFRVAKHIISYNRGQILILDDTETVNVFEALPVKFDYGELMKGNLKVLLTY